MKPILLTHLGLGDTILSAGMIVHLANRHHGVRLPCWRHNMANLRTFFAAHPSIDLIPIEEATQMEEFKEIEPSNVIETGCYHQWLPFKDEAFDAWIYRTAGVPFHVRLAPSPLLEALPLAPSALEAPREPFIFVHETTSVGVMEPLRNLPKHGKRLFPSQEHLMFQYAEWIAEAEEIHVTSSSFCQLCDSLPTKGKLVLHAYARGDWHHPLNRFTFRKLNWEIWT